MLLKFIKLTLIGLLFCNTDWCEASVKVFSLNLHGYHPMGADTRYVETPNKSPIETQSKLFYFTPDELYLNNQTRLKKLALQIRQLNPDILFFQEVGAGAHDQIKTCEIFYNEQQLSDYAKNTVFRLGQNLQSKYQMRIACRGNLGWVTDSETFKNKRIVSFNSQNKKRIIFDYNQNPYPNGIIIEGLGALISPTIDILEASHLWLSSQTQLSKPVFFQYLVLKKDDTLRLALNMHGNWDFDHFDQALAIRTWTQNKENEIQSAYPNLKTAPTIIAGDFNAPISPNELNQDGSDPSIALFPWLLHIQFIEDGFLRTFLKWTKQSQDSQSKSNALISATQAWLTQTKPSPFYDAIADTETCLGTCEIQNRLDLILTSQPNLSLKATIIEPHANWVNTNSLSDHPGVYAEIKKVD